MRILGYQRADGRMGIRNHVAVIYTVECAKVVAQKIAIQFPGTQVFGRRTGCDWSGPIFDKLVALGCHPNVGAVVVVGLGCEYIEAPKVAAQIAESGKPVEAIVITQAGGTLKSVDYGARVVSNMLEEVDCTPRAPMKESDLVVAVDCAGSDATSGLASNPAVGVAADLLVQAGGTVTEQYFGIPSLVNAQKKGSAIGFENHISLPYILKLSFDTVNTHSNAFLLTLPFRFETT